MNINELEIISFSEDGPENVPRNFEFYKQIQNTLSVNVDTQENINFCIMLAGQDKRDIPQLNNGASQPHFFALTSLDDRIIVVDCVKRNYFRPLDCFVVGDRKFINLDHIEISRDRDFERISIISKISDQSIKDIRFFSSIHDYVISYIDTIRLDIEKCSKGSSNFLDDLERLAKLRASGLICENEFVAAKNKILGIN